MGGEKGPRKNGKKGDRLKNVVTRETGKNSRKTNEKGN